jgi:hypothetical protein
MLLLCSEDLLAEGSLHDSKVIDEYIRLSHLVKRPRDFFFDYPPRPENQGRRLNETRVFPSPPAGNAWHDGTATQ